MTQQDPQAGDAPIVEVDIGVSSMAAPVGVPERSGGGGRRILGLLALVVVASLVAAVVALRGDDDGPRAGTGERFFELWPAPDGTQAYAADTDRVASPVSSSTAFFGVAGAEDPFAKVDALVNIFSSSAESLVGGAGEGDGSSAPVQVRDTTGTIRADSSVGFSVHVLTFVEPGRRVFVVSRHLSTDAMVEFANALADGPEPALKSPVSGLSLVAASSLPGSAGSAEGTTRTVSYILSAGSNSSGAPLTLSFGPGGTDALRAARWWGGVATTVDGHRAMAVSLANGTSTGMNRLEWLLDDGTLVSVAGPREVEALRALAATVREVDRARWDELVQSPGRFAEPSSGSASTGATGSVALTPTRDGAARASLAGTTSGIDWVVEDRATTLCLRLGAPAGQLGQMCASGSITDARGGTVVALSQAVDTRALVVVPVARGTVAVTLQQQDGSKVAMAGAGELGEVSLFAAVVPRPASPPAGAPVVDLELTAADGTTSSRRAIVPAIAGPPSVPTTR